MRIHRFLGAMIVFLIAGTLGVQRSDAQVEPTIQDPWSEAKALYRDGAYIEAIQYIVEAAQRDPSEIRYVVSLARTHFQAGDHDRAVYYYDMYLGSPGVDAQAGRYAASMVRRERQSANDRRATPEEPPRPPDYETELLNSIQAQLERGPILTATGGGALASFRALLRSGYVSPSLRGLRRDIADALLAEATRKQATSEGIIPTFNLREWQAHSERYQLAKSLLPPAIPFDAETRELPERPPIDASTAERDTLDGWIAFCEGQLQYLNENYSSAEARFATASELLPDRAEPLIGALNSVIARGAREEIGAQPSRSSQSYIEHLRRTSLGRDDPQLVDAYSAMAAGAEGEYALGARDLRSFFLARTRSAERSANPEQTTPAPASPASPAVEIEAPAEADFPPPSLDDANPAGAPSEAQGE